MNEAASRPVETLRLARNGANLGAAREAYERSFEPFEPRP